MTNTDRINTPLKWLKYVHSLQLDDYGTKLDKLTRKACQELPNVGTICLLGLAEFSRPCTLSEVKAVVDYNLSPASCDRLVARGVVDLHSGAYRTWKINQRGLELAKEIRTALENLIAKATRPTTPAGK